MTNLFSKVCGICGIEKPISEYWIRKTKNGNNPRKECKNCSNELRRFRYDNGNREIILSRNKVWIEMRKDYKREYDRNRELKIKPARNKQRLADYHNKKINPIYRLKRSLRSRVFFAVTKGVKCDKTAVLIGCSIEFLKNHLEDLFTDGMSWDNYGRNGWQIDHKIPCASFDLSIPEQQYKCFHYSNLQPLWQYDNCAKGAKLIY